MGEKYTKKESRVLSEPTQHARLTHSFDSPVHVHVFISKERSVLHVQDLHLIQSTDEKFRVIKFT